jgi:glutamate dehydrogenase
MLRAADDPESLIDRATTLARESDLESLGGLADPDTAERVVRGYWHRVPPPDLAGRDPADLVGAAISHVSLGLQRPAGTALVRVRTPDVDTDGWSSPHTVVEVITDDMAFLVDSVSAELTRHDIAIHLVVHPQLWVRRDVLGGLQEIVGEAGPRGTEPAAGLLRESYIHVEVDRRGSVTDTATLRADLRRVLEDVRAVNEDWEKMRGRAATVVSDLRERPPSGVPAVEVSEAAALLSWMAEDNFTFLGYREYRVDREGTAGDDLVLSSVAGTGLGILRDTGVATTRRPFSDLPDEVRRHALEPRLLNLTKANSRATVHRPVYLDYVGVKIYGEAGEPVGERRFLGLFSATAYNASATTIPVVRRKVSAVLERSGLVPDGHDAKNLLSVLESYPRDELLQVSVDDLFRIAMGILQLQERRRVRLFVRYDDFGRFVSCLVYLPRERYNTKVRRRIQTLLLEAFHGVSVDWTIRLSESVLARLHLVLRTNPGDRPDVDVDALSRRLAAVTRSWDDDLVVGLVERYGEATASSLGRTYAEAFPEAYKEDYTAPTGVADIARLESLRGDDDLAMLLYRPDGAPPTERRFKVYRTGPSISLSRVLPILQAMGVEVTDERPYGITRAEGPAAWIYDFGLRHPAVDDVTDGVREAFQDAFAAVWSGRAESDSFNALVLEAGLTWREVAVLRAYAKYLRQIGSTFSQSYLESTLRRNVRLVRLLVDLFEARFDPRRQDGTDPAAEEAALVGEIEAALDGVSSLDEDRILRSYLALVTATVRTNHFQTDEHGVPKPYVAFKLDPEQVPDLPAPRPKHEIWVCSPRTEGVHLRFGAVARGGLRWSDRLEDFRTEVLGLVKAQTVKNVVIVPVGAKGGFVVKQPPAEGGREALQAEVVACYSTFVRGMLDLTDNLAGGAVVPPSDVVRHDGDDTYLVVAADKGTATFSDIANGIADDYGYWLSDAFASGGSAGYDHKRMGITARGAWESVRHHFRELGIDTQSQDFTAVGIGDMSGDVFGNGMLLSEHIRLVAAFDHRHVFVDPDPDPAAGYAERRRLFDLPRSSWDDYDRARISAGGGVWPRTAKSVPVSPQMKRALGVTADALTPAELIRAVLLAPVDLFWNGGIGTYVKSASETSADVGDRSNDAVRVNGRDLRCRVVGEGGNLGFTQRGRVEFALAGGLINTDAIDNSAGVDTSDHEVNIKILLSAAERAGELSRDERNALLAEMTGEVAALVLRDNYQQNVAIALARAQAHSMLPVHRRYLDRLVADGHLDRELEALPDDATLTDLDAAGSGLTGPEFAVLLAYTKITLMAAVVESDVPDDPFFHRELARYFPPELRERFAAHLDGHRLHREIVTTAVVNELVNQAGTTFAFRLAEETASRVEDIVRAHAVAGEIFGLAGFWREVEELDGRVDAAVQTELRLELRRLVERATRWLLHNRRPPLDVARTTDAFRPGVAELADGLDRLLVGTEAKGYADRARAYIARGVPEPMARRAAGFVAAYSGLDVVEVSRASGRPVAEVAHVYFGLDDRLELCQLRDRIVALPRDDRWQTLARAALRDDLYAAHAALAAEVLASTSPSVDGAARIEAWMEENGTTVGRAAALLGDAVADGEADLATLSVALRQVRGLIHASAAGPVG